jgi:hypothetical protein
VNEVILMSPKGGSRPLGTAAYALVFLIAAQACSNTREPEPAPPARVAPTTGAVQGQVVGHKSDKPLADQLVVLCEVTAEPKCTLRAALNATTGSDGRFEIRGVAPGRYTAGHAVASEKLKGNLKDASTVDPTTAGVLAEAVIDIGMDGKPTNIRGGVQDQASGLTFEFRAGKLSIIDVRAGATAKLDIGAWGQ